MPQVNNLQLENRYNRTKTRKKARWAARWQEVIARGGKAHRVIIHKYRVPMVAACAYTSEIYP